MKYENRFVWLEYEIRTQNLIYIKIGGYWNNFLSFSDWVFGFSMVSEHVQFPSNNMQIASNEKYLPNVIKNWFGCAVFTIWENL